MAGIRTAAHQTIATVRRRRRLGPTMKEMGVETPSRMEMEIPTREVEAGAVHPVPLGGR